MLSFWKADIQDLIIHKVGNKYLEEGVVLAENKIDTKELEGLKSPLMNFFLKSFKDIPVCSFWHPAELGMNDIYKSVTEIFSRSKNFTNSSKNIAKILYDVSGHPKINGGELYVAYFSDCEFESKIIDAVGIFKSETLDSFLKVEHVNNGVKIRIDDGINLDKLDKGCLILNLNETEGYRVFNLDGTNKNEAVYWKDEFLGIQPVSDSFHNTKNFLSVAKEFITTNLPEKFKVEKTNQIEYLSKSVDYFSERDTFDIKEFEETVFKDSDIIDSFRNFGSAYVTRHNIDIASSFEISPKAVKKQAKMFKGVVKLDKNFHLYIHGDTDLIEKGYDSKKGKHFYKIYFDKEG